ncbi:hypothetical protein AWJ20_922 [Sugiyamaella lignohabitans]|uniref:xylan 1,4-beta-xylosidase n=1 Tax=Sugiyamaella lignohabitans TaxID=796027 RepID=A0A167D9X3_9ASCO|nr:uncharacterized protein AWJ20_922 [Sugiyamaella lignohabitans]ANB12660.1 hypothetical protein AWJ20_922 [Sugiyamaella lignohabitans]
MKSLTQLSAAIGLVGSALAQNQGNNYVNFSSEANPQLTSYTLEHLNYSFPDCTREPLKSNLVCDTSAHYLDRARALVNEFTLQELINNTDNTAPGVPRLGIPNYQWWSEALHGIASSPGMQYAESGEYSHSTSFPQPILMGAAFDDDLIKRVATVVSTEGRAFNNKGLYGLDVWSPNINPFKDPRWGRGQETPGEDPFHISGYVYNLIQGLQGGLNPDQLKLVATCKHFAGYDLESWEEHSRLGFDAIISERDLVEYYLPAFQSCVRDAKAASVMCSYNAVNGVPSCANDFFLSSILRKEWGFDEYNGYVTSDCDAVYNVWNPHNYSDTEFGAAAASINAGCDLNCGQTYSDTLPQAFAQNLVTRDTIEDSVVRLYANLVRLGFFDPANTQPYRQLGWTDVSTNSSNQLAYQAAVEGIALLKNDGTLPLNSQIKKLALIGPWANATTQMQGNYEGVAPFLISPLQAAQNAGFQVQYNIGTLINSTSTANFSQALQIAKDADAVIYVGGIDNTIEAEAQDRVNITWPGNQLDLISQLSGLSKPLIVLQMGGGQIDSSSLKNNSNVNGLLWGGYPGQSGGQAILDILTGVVAPAGRLPTTQYPADYINQVPMTNMSLRAGDNNVGRTYMWYTGEPVYEFGTGLHYTTFDASWVNNNTATFNIQDLIQNAHPGVDYVDQINFATFTAGITNTGKVASDYVALLFASGDAGPAPQPKKRLVSYSRAHDIAPGQTAQVKLPLTLGAISRVDENGNRVLYPGTYNLALDTTGLITTTVTLTGNAQIITAWPTLGDSDFVKGQLLTQL